MLAENDTVMVHSVTMGIMTCLAGGIGLRSQGMEHESII